MNAKLWLINNIEFAQKAQKQTGEVFINDCARLASLLDETAQNKAQIHYQLTGNINLAKVPTLSLGIEASLPMLCQRCLGALQHTLKLHFSYQIADKMPDEMDELDDTDWLETASNMNLLELIEDELLLALPIAPTHAHNCGKQNMQSGEKPNPFAILKDKF